MELDKKLPNVIQYGEDGFGHQLEGTMGVISLHIVKKANYVFNYKRRYKFAHKNVDEKCMEYMKKAMEQLLLLYPQDKIFNERKHKHEVWKIPKEINENVIYSLDNAFFEPTINLISSRDIMMNVFKNNNSYLPKPSYDINDNNIVCHIRLGDARSRQRELELQYKVISYYQKKYINSKIIIHTNGDNIPFEENENTKIYDTTVHVLQVLSDFIHANTLIIAESSLSIVATWLCDDKTEIIAPSYDRCNLKGRIRPGYVKYTDIRL